MSGPGEESGLWVFDGPSEAGEFARDRRAFLKRVGADGVWAVRCSTRMVRAFGLAARVYVVAQVRR